MPTKQCLISRKVEVSKACPVCHGGAESVFHILTSCPFAKECWSLSRVGVYAGQSPIFFEWLEAMLNKGNKEARSEIAMLCWAVWAHRNGVVWNSKLSTAHQVLSQARLMFHQWSVISTLKLSGWSTNLVFSQLKEYSISLNCYKDIYP